VGSIGVEALEVRPRVSGSIDVAPTVAVVPTTAVPTTIVSSNVVASNVVSTIVVLLHDEGGGE
jgi:hypothetical protein